MSSLSSLSSLNAEGNAEGNAYEKFNEDIETLVDNIHSSIIVENRLFVFQNIVIKNIELDILFKTTPEGNIDITFFQDNLLDTNENNISLFSVITINKKNSPIKEFIKVSLTTLLEIIPTLTFDTLIGRFIPNNLEDCSFLHKKNSKLQNATERIFNNIGITVNNKSKECVVCYEQTNCVTVCNHYLCFLCCSQITVDENTDELPCPICRSSILYSKTGGCL